MEEFFSASLGESDPDVARAIGRELARQRDQIELIASENIVSRAVLEAQGSVLTNKYAEGYPGRRYYAGCDPADAVEEIAISRARKLFGCRFANVQPHSGAQANGAVLLALATPGDVLMGMDLSAGGHLTHGAPVAMSGKWFRSVSYGVRREDSLIDHDQVMELALARRPRLIIAGGSAYPRIIDFARFREIADACGALLMVDMAHFAGLVAAGMYPSPLPHAHVVTTTTHKTLRGGRGGMILTSDEAIARKINSAVFPGMQGGPLMHAIAGKAVALGEALSGSFRDYIRAVLDNTAVLAGTLAGAGINLVSGGSDTHLLLLDLRAQGLTGDVVEKRLEELGLTCNRNGIPFDPTGPRVTSGIRIGTPAATTRGFRQEEFREIGAMLSDILLAMSQGRDGPGPGEDIRRRVARLCRSFPLYPGLSGHGALP